jgi:antitoxin VapB
MRLHISNPRARALAAELAALTGETLTEAVIQALEERLDRQRTTTAAARMLAFAQRFSEGMPRDFHSSQHAELYGDDGLPC